MSDVKTQKQRAAYKQCPKCKAQSAADASSMCCYDAEECPMFERGFTADAPLPSNEETIRFLKLWSYEGRLQTFGNRMQFRDEALALIRKLESEVETTNGSKAPRGVGPEPADSSAGTTPAPNPGVLPAETPPDHARALLLLSELDGHLANAKWDVNATGRRKLREAYELLRSPVKTPTHPDPTGTTREPPHCPTCGCGLEVKTSRESCKKCGAPITHWMGCEDCGQVLDQSTEKVMSERQAIPVHEVVAALEREAETSTSPQWLAAQHLRRMKDWHDRTLICGTDERPSTVQSAVTRQAQRPETGHPMMCGCPDCM